MGDRTVRATAVAIAMAILTAAAPAERLEWDRATLVLIQRGGAYGRIVRADRGLVCCFERHGRVAIRRSNDDGRTWTDAIDVTGYAPGSAANPELLATAGGKLLLFFNGRPRDGRSPFTIGMAISADAGVTWHANDQPLYVAGTTLSDGCYEPAAVQLPDGEIRLYFANEHGHAVDRSQEIDQIRSHDGGVTWSAVERVSYRTRGRDGMPVPVLSQEGRSILLAIEDNGLASDHQLKPTIERLPIDGTTQSVTGTDDRRWGAVTAPPWPDGTYAGAPYLRQFPAGGPTALICQPADVQGGPQRARVFLGNPAGQHFSNPTDPFPLDPGRPGQWNSLLIKSASTVTAITTGTIGGTQGIWAIDGHLVHGRAAAMGN